MPADLYPTKTRLALLRQIANSQVMTDLTHDGDGPAPILLFPDAPTSWQDRVKVSARVDEMERAGWVRDELGTWIPTEAGYAVLDAHPPARS